MTGMSLLDVLRGVMLDPAEQAVYEADPRAYLGQHGYEDVDDADLSEAFGLVADTLPAEQARAAFTGEVGPDVPTLGEDTTDFDVATVPEPTDVDDASAAVDDFDDLDDADGDAADDDLGDAFGGGVDADADDTNDTDAGDGIDDGFEDGALSFGRGDDDGTDALGDADDPGVFGSAADADSSADLSDADLDDTDLDDGFDEGGVLTGDHDAALDLDDALAHDADRVDGLDDDADLPDLGGFGAADQGPDDTDIGSF